MNEVPSTSITDWITAISALGSLIVLGFYTHFTRKMQNSIAEQVEIQTRQTEELIRQRRLGVMPFLKLNPREKKLEIKNVGLGVAFNVEVDSTSYKLKIAEPILEILPNETYYSSVEGHLYSEEFGKRLDIQAYDRITKYSDRNVDLKVRFQDIEGNCYEQSVQMGKDGYIHGFVKLVKC
jgi:hypothetical protein